MVDWIVWYEDGTTFSSDDGDPWQAPREGVLIVAARDISCGRRLHYNQDTYCWQDDTWIPHDNFGCERYLSTYPKPIRLRGWWTSDTKFIEIMQKAVRDPRLPPKTAMVPRESGGRSDRNRYGNERE